MNGNRSVVHKVEQVTPSKLTQSGKSTIISPHNE